MSYVSEVIKTFHSTKGMRPKTSYLLFLLLIEAIYMLTEIVAARMLSPFFGNTQVVWVALIGVMLFASALGNFVGGKLSSNKYLIPPTLLIATAGLILFLCAISVYDCLHVFASIATFDLPTEIGAILASLFAFFLPSVCAGMIPPLMLTLADYEVSGNVTGYIYGSSTLGGLIGTFVGGFILVPMFPSNTLIFCCAFLLWIVAVFMLPDEMKNLDEFVHFYLVKSYVFLGLAVPLLFALIFNVAAMYHNDEVMVAEVDTQYDRVIVYDVDDTRYMQVGYGYESAMDLNDPFAPITEYIQAYDIGFELNPSAKDVLMIGGAGYSYPKHVVTSRDDIDMTVVEIDEGVTELAKKYFYLDDVIDKLNLVTDDGRHYLATISNKYDLIFNDSFSGLVPSSTMSTLEAITEIHDSLNPGGYYLTNILQNNGLKTENNGLVHGFLASELRTLSQVFAHVGVYHVDGTDNNIVIASDSELPDWLDAPVYDDTDMLLTDALCPVERLSSVDLG